MAVKILENFIDKGREFEFNTCSEQKLMDISKKYRESDEYKTNQLYFVLDDDDIVYALMYDKIGSDDFDCLEYGMCNWGCTNALYYNTASDIPTWSYL